MAKRSSITTLDPAIREVVDKLIREGRASIDEIVAHLRLLGAEVSRSAVGRYRQRAEVQMQRFREAQEISKVWIGRLQDDPQGDVGRLLSEMLKTVAFEVVGDLGEDSQQASPKDVMLLSSALKNIGQFEKQNLERELRVRKEVAAEAAEKVGSVGKRLNVSPEALATIRREVYGLASAPGEAVAA